MRRAITRLARLGQGAAPLVVFTAAVLHWDGYSFGGRNHSLQVPLLRMLLDRDLYRFDAVRLSFDGYVTFFFHGVAAVARLLGDLELASFLAYLVSLALLLSGARALTEAATGDRAAGWLAGLFFVANQPVLAGDSTHFAGLSHAEAVTGGLVWALAFWLRGRQRLAFVVVGLIFNLHALSALFVGSMILAGSLLYRARGPGRVAVDAGLALLCASPALLWAVSRMEADPIGSIPLWLEIMRARSSLHAFPFTLPARVYGHFALLLGTAAVGLGSAGGAPLAPRLKGPLLAVALLCAVGVAFAEWWPVPSVIRLQLLRSTKWLAYPALSVVASLVVWASRVDAWGRVAAVLVAAGLLAHQPALVAGGVALLLIAQRRRFAPVAIGAGALGVVLAAVTGVFGAAPDLTPFLARIGEFATGRGAALAVPAALLVLARRRGRYVAAASAAAVLMAIAVLPPFYASRRSSRREDDWKQVQDWARQNTPRHAIFLTPPQLTGFRTFSERGVVGEWKDGTQQFFSNEYGYIWWERMRALGGNRADVYDGLGRRALLEHGRRFGATYAVFPADRALVLPRAYATAGLVVYELREMSLDERQQAGR
jgi:hypothetical protein